MRVRVVVEKDAVKRGAEVFLPGACPVGLGLMLAPIGGLVGGLTCAIATNLSLASLGTLGRDFGGLIALGGFVGSFFALPVTAVLFPILFYARATSGITMALGAFAGVLVSSLLQAPLIIASGGIAGLVTGWIFARSTRWPS